MDEFDKEVIEESDKIINNFDPQIIKKDQDGEWVSFLIKDKNSDFQTWMDFDIKTEDCEWNKFIFHNNNSKDMIEKRIMDNDKVFDLCYSLVDNATINYKGRIISE